tara:strand:+ start:158 stop:1450 length:1293 start_codon:yes stop_codon:yes gene_type:complete
MLKKFNILNFENLAKFTHYFFFSSILYCIFFLQPNNYGDPNNYIDIAISLNSANLLRFPGYPLFIKITSLNTNLLYITIIVQFLIYIIATLSLEKVLKKYSKFYFFPTLILSFPKIVYMQMLLFPDGLILSLLILLICNILNEINYKSILIALILFLFKSFFIFLLIIIIFLLLKKPKLNIILYFIFIPFILGFYLFQPEFFVQFLHSKVKNYKFDIGEIEYCDYKFKQIDIAINIQHGFYFPVYQKDNLDNKLACDEKSISKNLSKLIIIKMIKEKPTEILIFHGETFLNSLRGMPHQGTEHLTSMIKDYYLEHNIFLENLKSLGFENKPNHSKNILIDKIKKIHLAYEDLILRFIATIIFFINIGFFIFNKGRNINDPIYILLVNYALFYSFFSGIVADRHIIINIIINTIIFVINISNKKKLKKIID